MRAGAHATHSESAETWTMAATGSLSWSDLPPELLGLVVKCLPLFADRVRLRAVCNPWRSNAQQQSLPPPLPWLTLPDGAFLSIPDGEIIRMPVPDDTCCYGSVDNWLFLMQTDAGCSLVNPFSRATVELPNLATFRRHDSSNATSGLNRICCKPVVHSPLDSSPDSLVSVLILDDDHCSTVCICQSLIATEVCRVSAKRASVFDDVVFFNGKLHSLACRSILFVYDIDYLFSDKPKFQSFDCIINNGDGSGNLPQPVSRAEAYLVECCGRLLRVRRFLQSDRPDQASQCLEHHHTVAFDVFEARLSAESSQWTKVDNLGGQMLFVGRHCSKSFPVVEYNGFQGDCMYFIGDYYPSPDHTADPLRYSGIYNMRTGMITPLLSETVAVPQHHDGQWCPTWIFPADYM